MNADGGLSPDLPRPVHKVGGTGEEPRCGLAPRCRRSSSRCSAHSRARRAGRRSRLPRRSTGRAPTSLDFGGVAMSDDGTGGLVYRERVDGRAHVFAAQFAGGRWRAPQRVDAGQRFDSSLAAPSARATAAGSSSRWVQEFGVESDRMYSATLEPGRAALRRAGARRPRTSARRPTRAPVARDVAAAARRTSPTASAGPERDPTLPPRVRRRCELRAGALQRRAVVALRLPAQPQPARSPVRAAGRRQRARAWRSTPTGNAVARLCQEPDDEFVDRIWARRLFGAQLGHPAARSARRRSATGRCARPADQFALDQSPASARRRSPSASSPARGSALSGTRVWAATIARDVRRPRPREFAAPRGSSTGRASGGPAARRPRRRRGRARRSAARDARRRRRSRCASRRRERASRRRRPPRRRDAARGAGDAARRPRRVGARAAFAWQPRVGGRGRSRCASGAPTASPTTRTVFAAARRRRRRPASSPARASATRSSRGSRARATARRSPPRRSTRRPATSPSTRPRTSSRPRARDAALGPAAQRDRRACATRSPSTTRRSPRTCAGRAAAATSEDLDDGVVIAQVIARRRRRAGDLERRRRAEARPARAAERRDQRARATASASG